MPNVISAPASARVGETDPSQATGAPRSAASRCEAAANPWLCAMRRRPHRRRRSTAPIPVCPQFQRGRNLAEAITDFAGSRLI